MKRFVICLVVLVVLYSFTGCEGKSNNTALSVPELLEPVAVQIDTATVEIDDIIDVAYSAESGDIYEGYVVPYVQELYFEVGGTLGEVYVIQGDEVKKGQVLATLDSEQLNEQIDSLEEQISYINTMGQYDERQIMADIQIAQEELEILKENNASEELCKVKQTDILLLQTLLEQAEEERELELSNLYRQLEELEADMKSLEIVAPFDGRIVHVNCNVQFYNVDSIQAFEPLLYIADETRLRLETEFIRESVINTAERIYAKINGKDYDLTYAPYDPTEYLELVRSGKIDTRFTFASPTEELASGQYAAIVIVAAYRENVLTIPANALYQDGKEWFVKKMVDGQQVRCDVEIGLVTAAKAEIVEGLQEGDVVYVKE